MSPWKFNLHKQKRAEFPALTETQQQIHARKVRAVNLTFDLPKGHLINFRLMGGRGTVSGNFKGINSKGQIVLGTHGNNTMTISPEKIKAHFKDELKFKEIFNEMLNKAINLYEIYKKGGDFTI